MAVCHSCLTNKRGGSPAYGTVQIAQLRLQFTLIHAELTSHSEGVLAAHPGQAVLESTHGGAGAGGDSLL